MFGWNGFKAKDEAALGRTSNVDDLATIHYVRAETGVALSRLSICGP